MKENEPAVSSPGPHIFWKPGEEREFEKQEAELDPKSLVCEDCWLNLFDTDLFEQEIDATTGFAYTRETNLEKVYTTTWGAAHKSATQGCNFCRLAVPDRRHPDESVDIGITRWMDSAGHLATFEVGVGRDYGLPDEDRRSAMPVQYSLTTGASGRLADIIRARPVLNRVSGSQAIARAKNWISSCPNHSKCRSRVESALLSTPPSRMYGEAPRQAY